MSKGKEDTVKKELVALVTEQPDASDTVLGSNVPDVTGRVRYLYRMHPVLWPGVGRVAEVIGLWLVAVTGH